MQSISYADNQHALNNRHGILRMGKHRKIVTGT